MDDRLYSDPDLVAFYDVENDGRDDFELCLELAADARSVLDLGCGTGQLAVDLAAGRSVTGVDPATAMLDVARSRPGGEAVTWVTGDARDIRLARRFDLVLLTGHAFQVFLTPADRRAVVSTIAAHLVPGGSFVFDTRNPVVERWREWVPGRSRRVFDHPGLGQIEAWNDAAHDPETGIVTYETHYRTSSGDLLSAESRIAFPSQPEVAAMLAEAGLTVERWLGDWRGGAWHPAAPEIIPIGGLRQD
jgi:SAM-dependent methyltransferase